MERGQVLHNNIIHFNWSCFVPIISQAAYLCPSFFQEKEFCSVQMFAIKFLQWIRCIIDLYYYLVYFFFLPVLFFLWFCPAHLSITYPSLDSREKHTFQNQKKSCNKTKAYNLGLSHKTSTLLAWIAIIYYTKPNRQIYKSIKKYTLTIVLKLPCEDSRNLILSWPQGQAQQSSWLS